MISSLKKLFVLWNTKHARYQEELRAFSIAELAHNGQVRKGTGQPYLSHPIRVAQKIRTVVPDSFAHKHELIVTALLHDAIEDGAHHNISVKTLRANDINELSVEAVVALTRSDETPYGTYVLAVTSNPIATIVKIFDMLDNLNDRPSIKQLEKYSRNLGKLLKLAQEVPQTQAAIEQIFSK